MSPKKLLPSKYNTGPASPEEMQEARRLHTEEGKSFVQVAMVLNRHPSRVRDWLAGAEHPDWSQVSIAVPQWQVDAMRRLWGRDGLTLAEIARRTGRSVETVKAVVRGMERGVPAPVVSAAAELKARVSAEWRRKQDVQARVDARLAPEAVRLYGEGLSIGAVCVELGATEYKVKKWLLEAGVELRRGPSAHVRTARKSPR